MYRRNALSLFVLICLAAGLTLGGCVPMGDEEPQEANETSEDPDNPDEPNDPEDPQDPEDPDDPQDPDDPEDPDELLVDADSHWIGPLGPSGGTFAHLWSAAGHYFAVQVDPEGRAQLWRSDDGDAWSSTQLPGDLRAHELAALVAHDDALYLIGRVLLRSDDGGESWETDQWQGVDAADISLARVFDGNLYVVSDDPQAGAELLRVVGGQAELVDADVPQPAADFVVRGQTMLVSRGSYAGEVFVKEAGDADWQRAESPQATALGGVELHRHAGAFYGTSEAGVWRSQNGRVFEELVSQPASQAVILGDELLFGLLEPWNYLMSIDISDPTSPASGLSYLGGLNDVRDFALATDGETVLASLRHDGLLRMDFDAERWQQISPTARPVVNVARTESRQWVLTDGGKIFVSTDGQTWEDQPIGDARGAQILAHDDALFVVTNGGDFVALRNYGGRWTLGEPVELSSGTPMEMRSYDDILLVPFAPTHLSGGHGGSMDVGGGLFMAENRAAHWTDWDKIDDGLPEEYSNRQTPPVYAMHAERGLFVVVGHDGIYRSVDGGESWQKAALEGRFEEGNLAAGRAQLAKSTQGLFALIATDSGLELRRSVDDGQTWSLVDHTLGASTVASELYARGSTLLLGTWAQGLLASSDGGQTWSEAGKAYPGGAIRDLQVQGTSLWAATGGGMMQLPLE